MCLYKAGGRTLLFRAVQAFVLCCRLIGNTHYLLTSIVHRGMYHYPAFSIPIHDPVLWVRLLDTQILLVQVQVANKHGAHRTNLHLDNGVCRYVPALDLTQLTTSRGIPYVHRFFTGLVDIQRFPCNIWFSELSLDILPRRM